jgi:tetratricopeptide (TPR) repeat protein
MLKISRFFFLLIGLAFCAGVSSAQDLGSSNGLFRSPNPATKKTTSSATKRTTVKKTTPPKRTTPTVAKTRSVKPKNNAKSSKMLKTGETAKAATARDVAQNSPKNAKEIKITQAQKTVIQPPVQNNIVITVGEPTSGEFSELYERAIEEGNTARDNRNYTKAEDAYLRAQSLKAGDSRAIYGLGNLYSDQQRWEEAERAYRKAIELDPAAPEANIALSFVLTQPIVGTNLSERYVEAEKVARRALELDGENALAFDQLGVALELQGIISDETENAYRKAIRLDPEFALAYAHLGRLLRRKGQAEESTSAYKGAIQLSTDVPTMILVADVMQSQQRYMESEQLLRRALREDPKNPTALYMLGRALTTRKSFEEAETVLKKSAEVSPNSFVAYMLLGSMYMRQNKFDNAEKSLQKALTVVSPNEKKRLAQEFEAVGDGFVRAGKRKDAARVYQQALELDGEKNGLSGKLSKAQESK